MRMETFLQKKSPVAPPFKKLLKWAGSRRTPGKNRDAVVEVRR